jgi:hypothetical protein
MEVSWFFLPKKTVFLKKAKTFIHFAIGRLPGAPAGMRSGEDR